METGLQTFNHQQKYAQWSERIAACRGSGQTVSQWCGENGISPVSYYKWQKRIFQIATAETPQFVQMQRPVQGQTVAVLHVGRAEIELREGISEETLAIICRCLGTC